MTRTTTETTPQVNGDPAYSSKFLPKVTSIPVITSLRKHLFIHVPQAEVLTTYVHGGLSAAFSYTHDTPIEPVLIKLDTLAASGFDKIEKEVPIVNASTNEVLEKTKISKAASAFVQLYTGTSDFVANIFDAYKGVLDPVVNPVLGRVEVFIGSKPAKNESQFGRIKLIGGVLIAKVDARVTPVILKTKETVTSIYTDKLFPIAQIPIKQYHAQKEHVAHFLGPIYCVARSRITGAESAAKDAWTKTKPNLSGPSSIVPALKSGIFVVITFGYTLLYPQSNKSSPKGAGDQTNGLVSGVEVADGEVRKRQNGQAF